MRKEEWKTEKKLKPSNTLCYKRKTNNSVEKKNKKSNVKERNNKSINSIKPKL